MQPACAKFLPAGLISLSIVLGAGHALASTDPDQTILANPEVRTALLSPSAEQQPILVPEIDDEEGYEGEAQPLVDPLPAQGKANPPRR